MIMAAARSMAARKRTKAHQNIVIVSVGNGLGKQSLTLVAYVTKLGTAVGMNLAISISLPFTGVMNNMHTGGSIFNPQPINYKQISQSAYQRISSAGFALFLCSRLLQYRRITAVIDESPRPIPKTKDKPSMRLMFSGEVDRIVSLVLVCDGVKLSGTTVGGNDIEGR
jgi:hypothetical protein